MVDFQDFITVVKEAQNSLNELKEQNKDVEEIIKDKRQSTYQEVYEYFVGINKMMQDLKLSKHSIFIETPITYLTEGIDMRKVCFKICFNDRLEIAVYLDNQFIRWITLYTKWESIVNHQKETGYNLDYSNIPYYAIETLVERWNEYKDKITTNIKDAIINHTANQIEKEKNRMIENQTVLKNVMSGMMN